jgi:hypothetical protein
MENLLTFEKEAPLNDDTSQKEYEHECRIRNCFAKNLTDIRPNERLIATESVYEGTGTRVDMRTVDKFNVLREWEFKIQAGYTALGQILTYLAMSRLRDNFQSRITGVIAAFDFHPELARVIEVMNLGIELVTIPQWMARAGRIPLALDAHTHRATAVPTVIPIDRYLKGETNV